MGTAGCGPCIGVIIKCNSGFAVYHFTPGDDPSGSLSGLMWVLDGCTAMVCGGEDTFESNCLASYVLAALRCAAIPIVGVSGSSGCGYDPKTGKWYEQPPVENAGPL